ncbi:hypothetical protein RHGRI_004761 [Rhododendron griersonianum]|uniref:Uncharacterized protein n=1 Tax=Rhododendron griersonianum TaxID=479676 RepID=A0AAV6L9T4_9ERIC|nr:hypothetical protein RHGRI_004761 [Rhododendron griersonianum]
MAESQKQASSPVNLKDKDSLLDMDFGKDFLSSWKTMSVADGDAMDFDFGPVGKGKKKAFNFDKLSRFFLAASSSNNYFVTMVLMGQYCNILCRDVDFTLDGDLDKISSFKVDISDLDISSPPKRAGKSKERSNESDGRNHQIKQDRFSFPFDFNELDSFSFDSSLMKQGTQSNNVNSKEMSSSSKCQGSGTDPTDGISESEVGLTPELPVLVGATATKIESPVGAGGFGDLDPIKKNSPSNLERNDDGPLKSATLPIKAASVETRIFQEKTTTTIAQEKNQESHQQEKITSPELRAQETMQDLTVQYVSVKESTQHSAPEIQVEVCSQATEVHSKAGGDRNDIFESVCGFGVNGENPAIENSPTQPIARSLSNDGERNKFGSDSNIAVGYADGAEPAQDASYSDITPSISISLEAIHDTSPSRDAQNANGKLRLGTLSSGGLLRKLSQMKEKQTGISQSKYFKKSDETESPSQQTPSSQAKPTMLGGKRIGYGIQGSTDEGRDGVHARDAQSGSNLLGLSRPHSGEINIGEAVQPGSRSNAKGLKSVGERYNASGALIGTKLFVSSRTCIPGAMKVETVQESGKKKESLTDLSSCLNPSSSLEQTNKSTTQSCVNPRLPSSSIVPAKNPNDVVDERRKLCSPKAGRSILDLSSLKISRTIRAKPHPSKSTLEKEIKPLRNTVRNVEQEGSTVSKMALSVRTEKQTPPTPHLKRKAFEGLNADMLSLIPSKRLSPSATETRNGERSDIVIDKEVCGNKNPTDGRPYNDLNDPQTFTPDAPQEVNMAELEIPLVLENDVNVEKADAYTKDLEDICNMLKKKHEEAKEILVRAIVNNNKLLMLNHPIYDEKISFQIVFGVVLCFLRQL